MEKEYRVYWMPATQSGDIIHNISGYEIDNWADAETLPDNALKFISKCEEMGTVATLPRFMRSFNLEEEIGIDDYIFITNKY